MIPKDNAVGGKITKVYITCEGAKKIEDDTPTQECEIVDILHTDDILEDIAILRCPGHHSRSYLPLSSDPLPLNALVHIIGYPGEIKTEWMRSAHSGLLIDCDASRIASEILLPPITLTATEGTIQQVHDACAFTKISTSRGMSGGCLLYRGKIYGISDISPTNYRRCSSRTQAEYRHYVSGAYRARLSHSQ
jgi:hypothetical protein